LIARINALTGANIQLVLGEWADMVARAEAGELHGLAASARHAERAERFLFSVSPYATHKFIFTRRGSAIASMDDLAGRRVGVLRRNLSDLKLLDAWPAIIRVELDSPLGLAVAVQNGDVDAAISSANLAWVATENTLPALRLAFPVPGSKLDLRYSIGKEHAPLLGIIDKALAAIEPVEMMRMLRKWGTEEQPNIALSAEERAWLAQKHSVRVRIGDHPPWEINSPEADGMAVDYLRIIGRAVRHRFPVHPGRGRLDRGVRGHGRGAPTLRPAAGRQTDRRTPGRAGHERGLPHLPLGHLHPQGRAGHSRPG
jgi:two-component system sensor histidine kinase EvgS